MNNYFLKILDAGKHVIESEKALDDAKRELMKACDDFDRTTVDTYLPQFMWDNGRLYQLSYERASIPKFREVPSNLVAVAPTAG